MATWWTAHSTEPDRFGTTVCVATGPSLSIAQLALLDTWRAEGRGRIIAVNDAYRFVPRWDVLYSCDAKWWHVHWPLIAGTERGRPLVTIDDSVPYSAVKCLRHSGPDGYDPDPECLRAGHNSGYQAAHLAAHLGARRIVLLGYDFQAPGRLKHCFGDHAKGLQRNTPWAMLLKAFPSLVEELRPHGVKFVNCSPGSALKCMPAGDLPTVLR